MQTQWRSTIYITAMVACMSMLPFSVDAQTFRALEIAAVPFTATDTPQLPAVFTDLLTFDESFEHGALIEFGDVNGDGEQELVVLQSGGTDALSELHVYSLDGELLARTIPYTTVWVGDEQSLAVGDIDGDGEDEIAISRPRSADKIVQILNGNLQPNEESKSEITVFEETPGSGFGLQVAIANVLNTALSSAVTEKEELIIATGSGTAPQIAIVNEAGIEIVDRIIPFAGTDTFGLEVSAVDTSGSGTAQVIASFMAPGPTTVKVYEPQKTGDHTVVSEFTVWDRIYTTGVRTHGIDINADGTEEIAVTPAGDAPAEVRYYRADGQLAELETVQVFEDEFYGGIDLATYTKGKKQYLLATPTHQHAHGTHFDEEKWIEVDISDQTTAMWENGYLHRKYYVSSGLPGTPTPLGEYTIDRKLPTHVYDGRPDYFYPNTKWNMRYKPGASGQNYYFHTAYWHNNFGNRMSHGCVNMREDEAEYLYNWTNLGTRVWIHE